MQILHVGEIIKSMKIDTKIFRGITIDRDEYEGEDSKTMQYSCNYCHQILVRLSVNDQNESWFCRNCSIEYPRYN
jgi:ribosomal protein L37AE/L43A